MSGRHHEHNWPISLTLWSFYRQRLLNRDENYVGRHRPDGLFSNAYARKRYGWNATRNGDLLNRPAYV